MAVLLDHLLRPPRQGLHCPFPPDHHHQHQCQRPLSRRAERPRHVWPLVPRAAVPSCASPVWWSQDGPRPHVDAVMGGKRLAVALWQCGLLWRRHAPPPACCRACPPSPRSSACGTTSEEVDRKIDRGMSRGMDGDMDKGMNGGMDRHSLLKVKHVCVQKN